MKIVFCDYCNNPAQMVKGDHIYPHRKDLYSKSFYYCAHGHPEAYVGCHPNSTKPLGRLADEELRKAKSKTHSIFDPIWRGKYAKRNEAYRWLAGRMNMGAHKCHIGMFNVQQCWAAQNIARKELEYLRDAQAKGYTAMLRTSNKSVDMRS